MKGLRAGNIYRLIGAVLLAVLAGCSTIDAGHAPALSKTDNWALLPVANYTETPEAGKRAESIAQSVLQQDGFTNLWQYPGDNDTDALLNGHPNAARAKALAWARKAGARYALTGSVQEWRYKVGVDGEPVAGLTFDVIDVSTGKIVWSATGSRSGWSRSSLAGVGQTLIRQLLAPLAQR
ncbi:penicillin-binding protein activator LpoB [Pandoraea sp.]|uniref:penicillin-binding protein activator LpoB n=1 Tax=Pandoraea sp. TaxID=1883445 RepID=UPI0012176EFA|nr:penicillin-binding protein activator LpoB [Pandoraea sp.]TAL53277.1 MAG: penicillin-binding protein activator LpoB [Pandoraea sp.]TAM16644.1 MAG: penicillin-binding protein activator LpoB [Pandoraea sp.]